MFSITITCKSTRLHGVTEMEVSMVPSDTGDDEMASIVGMLLNANLGPAMEEIMAEIKSQTSATNTN